MGMKHIRQGQRPKVRQHRDSIGRRTLQGNSNRVFPNPKRSSDSPVALFGFAANHQSYDVTMSEQVRRLLG